MQLFFFISHPKINFLRTWENFIQTIFWKPKNYMYLF